MAVVVNTAADMSIPKPEAGSELQKKRDTTKWLHRTKLCVYSLQGNCRLGDKCSYAHSAVEVQDTPNLAKTQLCKAFMEGACSDENCTFAHGMEELRLSPNYKNKLCKWYGKGRCRNGDDCGFAHGPEQLRAKPAPERLAAPPPALDGAGPIKPPPGLEAPPPGLTLVADDAKRSSPLVLDLEGSLLDEKAPPSVEEQVGDMSSQIVAMQMKMDELMLRSQVSGMRQVLEQLSAQCSELDATLKTQTVSETSTPLKKTPLKALAKTPLKTRLSAAAVPFKPSFGAEAIPNYEPLASGNDWPSDDSTSMGSGGFSSD